MSLFIGVYYVCGVLGMGGNEGMSGACLRIYLWIISVHGYFVYHLVKAYLSFCKVFCFWTAESSCQRFYLESIIIRIS